MWRNAYSVIGITGTLFTVVRRRLIFLCTKSPQCKYFFCVLIILYGLPKRKKEFNGAVHEDNAFFECLIINYNVILLNFFASFFSYVG